MDYNRIIGSNIRFERQKRKLTIEELSEVLNIAPGFLGLIERGQRGTSIKNLSKIANFFSLTLDELVTKSVDSKVSVGENSKNGKSYKYTTASSLINSLENDELDFIISVIKGLKKYNKAVLNINYDEE